jgi:two-component sensor histidine kinase
MQEMHHRVKNSLQQIASLLRLQLRHRDNKTVEETLGDCLNRILAIASVHELLSRDDLDHVGIRSVGEMLVQHQQTSLILPDRAIQFRVSGDDVHVTTTQATQVALILNELIQNAVEHGFKHAHEGEIHLNVEERDGEIAFWVSNSGDRLPEGFTLQSGHLGMQIVDSLTHSLRGRFILEDRLGWTVAEVKFQRAGGE